MEEILVLDSNGTEVGLRDRVRVSDAEEGVVDGICIVIGSAVEARVDYVGGDGRRVSAWWRSDLLTVLGAEPVNMCDEAPRVEAEAEALGTIERLDERISILENLATISRE